MTNAFTIPKTSALAKELQHLADKRQNAAASGRNPAAANFRGISAKSDERIYTALTNKVHN